MILFIVFAIIGFVYFLFHPKEGLVNYLKTMDEYNNNVKEKMKYYSLLYSQDDFRNLHKGIRYFVLSNVGFDIVVFIIILLISTFTSDIFMKTKIYNYSFDIYSLKDSSVIEGKIRGSIYGRTGYINEKMKYFFLRDYEYGKKICYIPANKTYINYDDESNPHITVYKSKDYAEGWIYKFLFDISPLMDDQIIRYEVFVPSGSIIEDTYEIDLE